jgi:hypothetical protein
MKTCLLIIRTAVWFAAWACAAVAAHHAVALLHWRDAAALAVGLFVLLIPLTGLQRTITTRGA